jgi:hypothetical protein
MICVGMSRCGDGPGYDIIVSRDPNVVVVRHFLWFTAVPNRTKEREPWMKVGQSGVSSLGKFQTVQGLIILILSVWYCPSS